MTALYIGNDMAVMFSGPGRLVDDKGTAVTGAEVHVVLCMKGTDDPVSGVNWPVVLQDQGDGVYVGAIPNTVEVEAGVRYDVVVTASAYGAGAQWRKTVRASRRPFTV